MKANPRRVLLAAALVGLVLVMTALLALVMLTGGKEGAEAAGGTGGDPQIIGFDMDPANTTPNTATTLGTIEDCIAVTHPATFDVDVFLDDVPTGKDLGGFNYFLNYDATYLNVTTCKNSGTYLLGSVAGSSTMDLGGSCPDSSGSLAVVAADTNTGAGEVAGSLGVLERYSLTTQVAGAQVVGLTLTDIVIGDAAAADWWATHGDQVWDAAYTPQYGIVAIDRTCPTLNHAPVADNVAGGDVAEDSINNPWTPSVSDPDAGDTLTCSIDTPPSHGSATVASDCSSGTYTPAGDYNGSDFFVYEVVDDGFPSLSDTGTVTFNVTPVNDAPDVTAPTVMTVPQGGANTVATTITDVDDTVFTCSVVAAPAHGNVTFGANCADVTYTTTNPSYSGPDAFTFRATDSGGGEGAGHELYDDQAVDVTISGVNQAPVVTAPATITTAEDSFATEPTTITDPDDTVFTCAVVTGSEPTHGAVTFGANCADVTYTATDLNYNGADSFTFRVTDSGGPQGAGYELSDDLPVSVTITPVNDAPVCNNVSVSTMIGTPVATTLNCSDPDAGDTLTYEIVAAPSHGALTGTAPALTYTPEAGYTGDDSFTYRAYDGTEYSNTATVSITITAAPAPPPPPTPTPTRTPTPTPTPTATPPVTPPAVESALAADAAAGSEEICVEDAEGFDVGDTIEIGSGDTAETNTITAVSDSCFTLANPLEFDHAAGEAVSLSEVATPTPVAICAPIFPGTYNGTVRLDGVPAPDGKVLRALISDTEWASATVSGGLYVLDIPETLPAMPPCFEGGTITFELNGTVCDQTPEWASGLHGLDLTCQTPVVTPSPTPEVTPTATPVPGTPTPVAPPPTGGGGLLGSGGLPWTAGMGAAGLVALVLVSLAVSRTARGRLR